MRLLTALAVLAVLQPRADAFAAVSEATGRISAAVLRDSNVFESDSTEAADRIGRFWAEIGGRFRPAGRLALSAEYSGGADVYAGHPSESRHVHAAGLSAETGFGKAFAAGADLRGRAKTFMRGGRGYSVWSVSPFLRLTLFGRAAVRLTWTASGFDYAPSSAFDYRSAEWSAAVESSPLPRVKWSLGASSRGLNFERRAVAWSDRNSPEREWRYLSVTQRDRITEASASVEAYCGGLWVCRVSVRNDRSNSYGYSCRDPIFEIGFGKVLPWGLNARAFWTHREKTYADALAPLIRIRPDAEDETNSQALLDLSRRFRGGWTGRLRAARYRNESPIRTLYYEKTVTSLGLAHEW
jgi:hypothetical protein